jgi:hypothetical protein
MPLPCSCHALFLPCLCRALTKAWQERGKSMARGWQGKCVYVCVCARVVATAICDGL